MDHIVLIREPWRSINRRDLELTLRVPLDVEIPHSRRVARLCDAGLLAEQLQKLEEFAQLKAWAKSELYETTRNRFRQQPS